MKQVNIGLKFKTSKDGKLWNALTNSGKTALGPFSYAPSQMFSIRM